MAKQKLISIIWINHVGDIINKTFKVLKEDKENIFGIINNDLKIGFSKKKIKNNTVFIFENIEKKLHILDPNEWRNMNLAHYDIKEYRFNLRNFREQESISATNRWTVPQNNLDKLLPIFRLMIIAICVGTLGWFAFKFSGMVLGDVTGPLKTACNIIIPPPPVPVDAGIVQNITTPIY